MAPHGSDSGSAGKRPAMRDSCMDVIASPEGEFTMTIEALRYDCSGVPVTPGGACTD